MSTWGTGPFDNDEAMDLFGELENASADMALLRLRSALAATAERPGHVELNEANEAVAAAALVAACRAGVACAGQNAVDAWLVNHRPRPSDDDQALALRALERVCGPQSEWLELWKVAGEEATVRARVERFRELLTA